MEKNFYATRIGWIDAGFDDMGLDRISVAHCPAGRAHYAWGDHFVVGIPVLGGTMLRVLPLVGGERMIPTSGRSEVACFATTS
jgi:hypothetical protein